MNKHIDPLNAAHRLGQMHIMDTTGHTTITWDARNPASVADARAKFQEYIGRGYSAFAMDVIEDEDENGTKITVEEKGERVTEFDPTTGKLMLIPQLRGG